MTLREFTFGVIGAALFFGLLYVAFAFIGGDLNWFVNLFRWSPVDSEVRGMVIIARIFIAVIILIATFLGFVLGLCAGEK